MLRQKPLGTLQLARAQQQLIVQLAINNESGLHEALGMARNFLVNDEVEPTAQTIRKIQEITSGMLLETANEVFDEQQLSTLIFESNNA